MRTDVDDADRTSLIIGMALAFVVVSGYGAIASTTGAASMPYPVWWLAAAMFGLAGYKSYRDDVSEHSESPS